MGRDCQKEVDDAVNAISEKLKAGTLPRTSGSTEEDAADAVFKCIIGKTITIEGDHPVSTPVQAVEVLNWAAEQLKPKPAIQDVNHDARRYFVQLLKKRGVL